MTLLSSLTDNFTDISPIISPKSHLYINTGLSQIIENEILKADVYRLQGLLKIVTLCYDIKYYKNPYDL